MSKGLDELKRLAYENACCRCQYYIDNKCINKGECVWLIIEQELKAFKLLLSYGISYNDLREIIITLVCGYGIKTMEDLMSLLSIGELNNG